MYKLFAQRRGRNVVDLPDAPAEPGWLPFIGTGACLYSAVVAYHLTTGCSKERAVADIYGPRVRSPSNLFGIGASDIARKLFANRSDAVQILREHSLFGVYGKTLTLSGEEVWSKELASGGGAPLSLANHFYLRAGPIALWNELRFCLQCVEDDIFAGRLPEWKVLHQLPFLTHCPTHQTSLICRCQGCQSIYERGSDFRVPGQSCVSCGMLPTVVSRKTSPSVEISLGSICKELQQNELQIFRPGIWSAAVKFFLQEAGGRKEAIRILVDTLKIRWNVSRVEEILQSQGYLIDFGVLGSEIDLLAVSRPWLRIVIFDALNEIFGEALETLCVERQVKEKDDHARLYASAIVANIPVGVIDKLLRGHSLQEVSEAAIGVKYTRMREFFRGLPADLLAFMASKRPAKSADRTISVFSNSDQLSFRREALEKLIAERPKATRAELRSIAGTLVNWLYQNDKAWLDSILPCKVTARPRTRFRSVAEQKKAFRKAIIDCKARNPGCCRTFIRKREQAVCRWLVANDLAWLEKQLPPAVVHRGTRKWYRYDLPFKEPNHKLLGRYPNDRVKKREYSKHIIEIIDLNPHLSRSEVERAAPSAVPWLRTHDPACLEKLLPRPLHPRQTSE